MACTDEHPTDTVSTRLGLTTEEALSNYLSSRLATLYERLDANSCGNPSDVDAYRADIACISELELLAKLVLDTYIPLEK